MNQTNPPYRWTFCSEKKILVTAVGFGIGPKIAAENLLIDINAAKEGEPIEWHETGIDKITPFLDIKLLINFGVIAPLPEFSTQYRIWIDCVDWLRTSVPSYIQRYDLLLREAFFPSRPGGDRGDPAKWHDIQPILRTQSRATQPEQNMIVMSFGGVATPYSTKVHAEEMPMTFLHGACQFLDNFPQKYVIAFIPEALLKACKKAKLEHERLLLRPIDRIAFKEVLARCSLLICQAGLYTPFEAIKMGIPFALTYPMSFTQERQGAMFEEMGVERCQLPIVNSSDCASKYGDIESIEKTWFNNCSLSWSNTSNDSICNCVDAFLQKAISSSKITIPTKFYFDRLETAKEILTTYLNENNPCD